MMPGVQGKSRSRIGLTPLIWVAAVLAGCAPTVLPPSGPHAALATEQVKIYQNQPAKYELLGTIEVPVTAEMKWDEHADSTAGFLALKAKAGALGANGILLKVDENLYDIWVGAGFNGSYYLVPLRREPKTALAAAIYVIKE
jgi:hypothetical protein